MITWKLCVRFMENNVLITAKFYNVKSTALRGGDKWQKRNRIQNKTSCNGFKSTTFTWSSVRVMDLILQFPPVSLVCVQFC